jgi:hypothetical protein
LRENDPNELLRFKQEINLVSFALSKGYRLRDKLPSSGTQKRSVTLYRPYDNSTAKDVIWVSRAKNGHYLYKSFSDDSDKGSIIDFCMHKFSMNLGEIRAELRHFINTPIEAHIPQVQVSTLHADTSPVDSEAFDLSETIKTQDFQYLTNVRKIDTGTLLSPLFKGTYGIHTSYFNKDKQRVFSKTGAAFSYRHFAFKIYAKSGSLIGLEIKDQGYAGTLSYSRKAVGMWHSNIPKNKKTGFFFSESPIDALSHYQLHRASIEASGLAPVYFASNGSYSSFHLKYLQYFIDQFKPAQCTCINDNDLAGIKYNAQILGLLKPPPREAVTKYTFKSQGPFSIPFFQHAPNDVLFDYSSSATTGTLSITIQNDKHQYTFEVISKRLYSLVSSLNKSLLSKHGFSSREIALTASHDHNNYFAFDFQFKHRPEIAMAVLQFIKAYRPLDNFIAIQFPKTLDFNADLVRSIAQKKTSEEDRGQGLSM